MIHLNYQKRKNIEIFTHLENPNFLFLSKTQNYIPIYSKFFSLNETNYNHINLNHKYSISSIIEKLEDDNENIYTCKVKNIDNNKTKEKETFVKIAPLLDSFKYLVGKYNINDSTLFNLPNIHSTDKNTHPKLLNVNNSAYVDGFFLFLTSSLLHNHQFIHGVDYYGSFLSIKNNFKFNIFDDIDYLSNSDFFKKNKNVLFKVDDYEHLFDQEYENKLSPIKIEYNSTAKSNISAKSFENNDFEDIFIDSQPQLINLNDVKDMSIDLIDITNSNFLENSNENNFTLNSSSNCSSRSSYTSNGTQNSNDNEEKCEACFDSNNENEKHDNHSDNEDNDGDNEDESIWEEESEEEEEQINVTIPSFPVQVIFMENCEDTFDNLILSNELKEEEWLSAFMQIIMILITYQKSFSFTHNDLHTNNVMYNSTDKKYLYYYYKKRYYKVPTFGRIFKIIDFGRSIFKFNGNLFCSDSFQLGGDASTQYNTEPFFNETKPRLEPNFSFDICRLACSIFDFLIEDMSEIKDIGKLDTVKKLVVEWCLDDKGINLLYKNNGVDRYPDFKLYKMIARCVHNHTPQSQLERPEFKQYEINKSKENIPKDMLDIDSIPVYV
jgi:hypothetical protein